MSGLMLGSEVQLLPAQKPLPAWCLHSKVEIYTTNKIGNENIKVASPAVIRHITLSNSSGAPFLGFHLCPLLFSNTQLY